MIGTGKLIRTGSAARALTACCRWRLSGSLRVLDPFRDRSAVFRSCLDAIRVLEGAGDRAADDALALLREHCEQEGREIPHLLPLIAALGPHSRTESQGSSHERRISTNVVVPLSVAEAAAIRARQFFGLHRARMQAAGLAESYLITGHPGVILLDLSLCWHEPSDNGTSNADSPSDNLRSTRSLAQTTASELCEELRALFTDLGAAHVGLAKAYPYRSVLAPQFADAWDRLRQAFDPDRRLNPDNLDR